MQDWLPHIPAYPTPRERESFTEILTTHDVVLLDPSLVRRMHLDEKQRKKLIELTPTDKHRKAVPGSQLDRKNGSENDLLDIMSLTGRRLAICGKKSNHSMVTCSVEFCTTVLGIPNPDRDIGLRIIPGVIRNKYTRRIVVFPTSPVKKKEYPYQRYAALLRSLNREGWEPVVAVTPREFKHWSTLDLPCQLITFDSISEMARFICESTLVVSNDSGGGHLASALGIPTVTVCNDRKPLLWRPDWGPGDVIGPNFVVKLVGLKIWSPFVSRRKILRSVRRLAASSTEGLPEDQVLE